MSGIPPVSDYAGWNEDAERVWFEENRYDMEYPPDPDPDEFYDREYDDYDGDEHPEEDEDDG